MAEGARLLSECGVISSTEGSNPSLSATSITTRTIQHLPFERITNLNSLLEKKGITLNIDDYYALCYTYFFANYIKFYII